MKKSTATIRESLIGPAPRYFDLFFTGGNEKINNKLAVVQMKYITTD